MLDCFDVTMGSVGAEIIKLAGIFNNMGVITLEIMKIKL